MITATEIIKALSDMIETVTGAPPTTKDVTKGFPRPCTWVRPLDIQPEAVRGLQRDLLDMEIVYFAPRSWEGWKTLLKVQADFAAVLTNPVPVSDTFLLYPEDLEFVPSREDMTLVCTFSLENYQLLPPSDATMPVMEHLDVTGEDPEGEVYETAAYGEVTVSTPSGTQANDNNE